MILWALCTLHLWRYYGHGYLGIVWGLLRYEDMSSYDVFAYVLGSVLRTRVCQGRLSN